MLRTATGRAYLSFCSERERAEILEYLHTEANLKMSPVVPKALDRMIATCRRNGYGTRLGEAFVRRRPVFHCPFSSTTARAAVSRRVADGGDVCKSRGQGILPLEELQRL